MLIFLFSGNMFGQTEYLKDETAGFSIKAPGTFLEKYQQVPTDLGSLEVLTYYHQPDIENPKNYLYLINYIEYPAGSLHHDSLDMVKDLFSKSIEEFNFSVGGKLIYQTPFLDERPPHSIFRSEYDDGFKIVKAKMIVDKNRFYFLQVFTTKPHSLNKGVDDFLESFMLLN